METRERTTADLNVGTRCTDFGFPRGQDLILARRRGGGAHLLGGLMGVDALAVEEEAHGAGLEGLAGAERVEDLRRETVRRRQRQGEERGSAGISASNSPCGRRIGARAARDERAYLLELGRVPDLEVHLGVVLRRIGTGRAVRDTPRRGGLKRRGASDRAAGDVTRDNGLATYLILDLQVDVVSLVVSLLFLFLGHGCCSIRCVVCVEVCLAPTADHRRRLPAVASSSRSW